MTNFKFNLKLNLKFLHMHRRHGDGQRLSPGPTRSPSPSRGVTDPSHCQWQPEPEQLERPFKLLTGPGRLLLLLLLL